jgi:hypothetical protein
LMSMLLSSIDFPRITFRKRSSDGWDQPRGIQTSNALCCK